MARKDWSLTRRLAVVSAITTCMAVALYGAWSTYFVFASLRDDLKAFMTHETEELALALSASDGSLAEISQLLDNIAEVSQEPPCAFRVRDAAGELVAQAGDAALLVGLDAPVRPEDSWRILLEDRRLASSALEVPRHDIVVEVFVDARPAADRLQSYLVSATLAFFVVAVIAGFAGWYTTRRGLRSLRDMVAQAEGVDLTSGGATIRLDGAPSEITVLGRALTEMIARIDAGLERMQTFTAGLAHELRSPLQNLIGETEVALLAERPPQEYVRVLRSNLDDLGDLSDAIDNLVAFCRNSVPASTDPQLESFDLADEATLRLERERRRAATLGVDLQLRTSGTTQLIADREGCLRVVRNLVGNAIECCRDGGHVQATIEGHDDEVRVIVEDDGPGIPASLGERIFDAFVSGPRQEGRRQGGYGLGLAICRSVVRAHGGRLAFDGDKTDGARFVAAFPRERPAPQAT